MSDDGRAAGARETLFAAIREEEIKALERRVKAEAALKSRIAGLAARKSFLRTDRTSRGQRSTLRAAPSSSRRGPDKRLLRAGSFCKSEPELRLPDIALDLSAAAAVTNCEAAGIRAYAQAGGLDPATDFRGLDLSGMPLAGQRLSGFDFSFCDLRGTGIERAIVDFDLRLYGSDPRSWRCSRLRPGDRRIWRHFSVDLWRFSTGRTNYICVEIGRRSSLLAPRYCPFSKARRSPRRSGGRSLGPNGTESGVGGIVLR